MWRCARVRSGGLQASGRAWVLGGAIREVELEWRYRELPAYVFDDVAWDVFHEYDREHYASASENDGAISRTLEPDTVPCQSRQNPPDGQSTIEWIGGAREAQLSSIKKVLKGNRRG